MLTVRALLVLSLPAWVRLVSLQLRVAPLLEQGWWWWCLGRAGGVLALSRWFAHARTHKDGRIGLHYLVFPTEPMAESTQLLELRKFIHGLGWKYCELIHRDLRDSGACFLKTRPAPWICYHILHRMHWFGEQEERKHARFINWT